MTLQIRVALLGACLFPLSTLAADIGLKETPLGAVYTDSQGMTLYYYDHDTAGASLCNDGCATAWPPLLVQDTRSRLPEAAPITRADGNRQWALAHRPLYRWHKDRVPGDITGAGVKNLWSLARADNAPVRVFTTDKGRTLTTRDNLSLYTYDKDPEGASVCEAGCATNWPPLLATKEDIASGPFSIVARKDGRYQWAYQGKPLYTWIKDKQPGDRTGDNVNGVWHLVHL